MDTVAPFIEVLEEMKVDPSRVWIDHVEIEEAGYRVTSPEDLVAYSYDGTFAERRPDAVVRPDSTDQVSEVMKVAWREEIPMIPRGMASGLAAASIPLIGGIVLAMEGMDQILEIDEENLMCVVQPGVITGDLQEMNQLCLSLAMVKPSRHASRSARHASIRRFSSYGSPTCTLGRFCWSASSSENPADELFSWNSSSSGSLWSSR